MPGSDLRNGGVELIAVRSGQQQFAIDIMSVREIRGWTVSTPLAHAPSHVLGMINLRGTVLPVIDLGARLGLGSAVPGISSVVVVVQVGEKLVGLLVDEVCDILAVRGESVQDVPEVGSEAVRRFVRGIMPTEEGIVSLLSLDHVLDHVEDLAA